MAVISAATATIALMTSSASSLGVSPFCLGFLLIFFTPFPWFYDSILLAVCQGFYRFSLNNFSACALWGAGFFFARKEGVGLGNPRYANGALRRRHRARLRAMGLPCAICKGRLGPIHYDEPSDPAHPLSFVVDEIRPVSRWREFGYPSARAAAEDWDNLQPAHYFCNQLKGSRTGGAFLKKDRAPAVRDGDW